MIHIDDATLLGYLKDDAPYGDLTSRTLDLKGVPARMTFAARGPMVVCGIEEAARLLALIGCEVQKACASGDRLPEAGPVLEATGPGEAVLVGWKVAQMLVEWTSGVATAARRLTDAARAANPEIIVACTRKAIPGTHLLSAKAVLAGGATLHRTGLSDTVLLFPEHRALGAAPDVLAGQIERLKAACPERSVVVEVKTVEEALVAADSGADVLQLEKFPPDKVAGLTAALMASKPVRIAAAGGVTAANAEAYARSGAAILVTSAPYYAKPCDVQVSITRH